MAHWRTIIVWDQSNGEGRLNKSNAPDGMFTAQIVNGVYQFNGADIEPFDVKDDGPTGNGHSYVGNGQSDDCYAYPHELAWMLSQHYEDNILLLCVTNGGALLRLANSPVAGSHNVDVATLASSHPTTPILHTPLVERYNAFVSLCENNEDTYEILACITSQGEGDADALNSRLVDLQAKDAAIRSLVDDENLPMIRITQGLTSNYYRPYADWVAYETSNFVVKGFNFPNFDGAHHTPEAITHIAKRCFAIITGQEPDENPVTLSVPSIIGSTFDTLEKYLEEANVTDSLEQQAAESLYTNLISNDLWDLFVGIFPMLGTDYTKNLRNPFYRPLTLSGASAVSGGLNFDGSNDEVDTNFRITDMQGLFVNNFNISAYLTENNLGTTQALASWASGAFGRFYAPFFSSPNNSLRMYIQNASVLATINVTDVRGLVNFGVTGGNATIHRNGANIRTVAYSSEPFIPARLKFGVDYDGNDFLDNVVPFIGYGFGLSDAQVAAQYSVVQAALSIVGRSV